MAQIFLSSLLKVFFILTHAGLIWFVIVSGFDQITLAVSLLFAYKYQKLPNFFRYFDLGTAKKLLRSSWPLVISSIAISIYMRIDQVMIKEMIGNSQLGFYSASVKIATLWYFIPTIIASSLFPAIVSAKKNNINMFYNRLQKLYAFMFWIAVAVALPVTFLSGYLINFIYGTAYSGAAEVLRISIWTGVFVSLGVVTGNLVIVNNKQKYGLIATVIAAVTNAALNYFLIPIYGIIGAALATLIAQIISGFIIPSFLTYDAEYPLIVFRSVFWKNKYGN
jgi:O-antigen/teichoic acid export membrane protein